MLYERIATTAGRVPTVRDPSLTAPATGRPRKRSPERPPRPGRVASDRKGRVRLDVLDLIAPWVVAVATLAARLATAAKGPTDWDSAQYASAVAHFDLTHGRPQPPGYWLYVVAGRLGHGTGLGTVESLVLVSALASAAAAGLVVVAGRDLGGRWVGLAAGVLVATSPFAWFSGSTVGTYSFDLAIAPLLIILAWRARPHSWHGVGAVVALGLVAGFRQSALPMFAVLALVAVVGSVRRARELVLVVAAGGASVAAWFVPMILTQSGGLGQWFDATRIESRGAYRATSVLDHAAGGGVNLGTFAAYTSVALVPLAALALVAVAGLGARALFRRLRPASSPADPRTAPPWAATSSQAAATGATVPMAATRVRGAPRHRRRAPAWSRPWYQSRTSILLAATVPPMAVVALVQFAKGGYLLAYLPGAVIALLLAPGALLAAAPARPDRSPSAGVRVSVVVASLAVAAIAVVGADRFLVASAVLPVRLHADAHGLWLTQTRYQAPYGSTRATIRSSDALDAQLARLGPLVDPRRDVVVLDSLDGGTSFYRNAGWSMPAHRVALIVPGAVIYNEQGGSLYYTLSSSIPVAPGGSIYLIASPSLPGLEELAGTGRVTRVRSAPRIADYLVWKIAPGSTVLGVRIAAVAGPRPLGTGLTG